MLQALVNVASSYPIQWLPIREKDSPCVPFDFAGDRILEVPRNPNEPRDLQDHAFERMLRNRVQAMTQTT
jgi:hypothetical protein